MADRGKTLSAKIQQETDDDVIGIGEVYKGVCDSGMTPSTTTIVSYDLKGFGDDFFNNDWVMIVLYNYNNHGVAPEREVVDINDYVSATGTFTTDAFTANVEADDEVMVAYTNHNQFSLAVPAADSTDNVLERDVIGNKTDTSQTTVGATRSLMGYVKGSLDEINEILDLTRTGGDIAVTAAEANLFIDDAPTKIINGISIKINTEHMAAGDTYKFREYYRDESGGGYIEVADPISLIDAQSSPLYMIKLQPYRYGCKITAEKIEGTDRNFKIEAIVGE